MNEFNELLEERLEDSVHYFRRGRHSLVSAFKAIGLKAGDVVLMPEYICRDLLSSLHAIGVVAAYYPIGKDLTPSTSFSLWPAAKAVLAVNYFGFPQDLNSFREYCNKFSAVLIEDNAHGFLSQDSKGINLGFRGDIGIFSFGKTVMLASGSLVFISKNLESRILQEQLPFLKNENNVFLRIKFILHRLPISSIVVSNLVVDVLRKIRKLLTGREIELSTIQSEKIIPAHPSPSKSLLKVLNSVDFSKERERRRNAYSDYSDVIKRFNAEPVFSCLPEKVVPYGFPFTASDEIAKKISDFVKQKSGFDVFRWPELPEEIQKNNNALYMKIWVINFLW